MANMVRYSFVVRLFHSLLSTDLNRRFRPDPFTIYLSSSRSKTKTGSPVFWSVPNLTRSILLTGNFKSWYWFFPIFLIGYEYLNGQMMLSYHCLEAF